MSRTLSPAVSAEIAKKGSTASPRHLYRLYLDGGTLYYTDHHEDYAFGGQTYQSRAIKHSAIKTYMADRVEGCTVSIDNVDKAMSAYLEAGDFEGRRIEIDKVFLGLTAQEDFIPLFRGDMDTPEDGEEWFTIKAGNINDRREGKSPWRRFGLRCNWDFCGSECGYNSGTKQTGTADSGAATTLVDAALPARTNDYWAGATLRILSGTNKGESRIVSAYDDALKKLTVLTAFSSPIDNTSKYVLECDKARATCEGFVNQSQFDGFDEQGFILGFNINSWVRYPDTDRPISASNIPIPLLYGTGKVPGVMVDEYVRVANGPHGTLWSLSDRLCAFCEGEIDDISGLSVRGIPIPITSFTKYTGSATQSFDFHGETKYYRRTALIRAELLYEYWDGASVEAVIRGLKVQKYLANGNPDGSPAWSDNPAWCILDFIMNRAAAKTPSTDIDFSAFYDAAAACTSLGYRLNLAITKQEKEQKIIERMRTACRGYFTYHGGKVGLHVEKAASTVFTFDDLITDNDNIKPDTFKPYKKHLDDVANRTIVTYTDEQVREKMAVCDGTLLKAATTIHYKYNNEAFDSSGTVYIGEEAVTYTGNTGTQLNGCSPRLLDYTSGYPIYQGLQLYPELTAIYQDYEHQEKAGRVIEKKLDGAGIPTYRQAYGVAEWYGRKAVEGNLFCKLTGFIDSLGLTVGDVVNVTHGRRGWVDRPFRVIEAQENMDEEVQYTLQIYDDSFYPSAEALPPTPRETTLPNPYDSPAHVTNLAAVESSTVYDDGTVHAIINISFDEPTGDDLIFWDHALVFYSTDNWATVQIHGAFESGSAVKPLDTEPGKTYKIKAVSVSKEGVSADSSTAPEASVTINGDTTAPALPTGISASSVVAGVQLAWTNPSDSDFQHVAIYRNTTDTFPGGSPYMSISGGPGKAMSIRDRNVSYGSTYYYWLKSVDTTGNASSQSSSVNAAPARADTADIADGAITDAKVNDLSADKINAGSIRGINVTAASHMTKGSYLTAALSGGETTVYVKDTTDFPSSGSGWFIDTTNDRDAFSWTGKTATTLTGCSGVLAHNNGAVVVPESKAMVIADNVNEMRFFGDRGDGTVEELASIGIKSFGYDMYCGVFGSQDATKNPILGITKGDIGIYGYNVNPTAGAGIGVFAYSQYGYALAAWCGNTGKGQLHLSPMDMTMPNPPTHVADMGTICAVLTSLYMNVNGASKWRWMGGDPKITGDGSQDIPAGSQWLPNIPAIYNFIGTGTYFAVEIYAEAGWRLSGDTGAQGTLICDGSNMRVKNTSTVTTYRIYFQRF